MVNLQRNIKERQLHQIQALKCMI